MDAPMREASSRRGKFAPVLFVALTSILALVIGCVGVVGGEEDEISDSSLAIRSGTIRVDPNPVVLNEAFTLQVSGLSADKPYDLTIAATASGQLLHSERFSVERDAVFSHTFDSSVLTSAGDYEARVELIQRRRNRLAGSLSFPVIDLTCTDCSPSCGNGVLESGETCDPPASCPADCDDGNSCTTDVLTGSALECNAVCSNASVDSCLDSDGCCPSGCDQTGDNDCSASCGNGALESGETCDPPSSCPVDCDDGNSCTTDLLTGSALTCSADCIHTPVAACVDGDSCCPGGCDGSTDNDCGSYVYFPAGNCETSLIELALNGVEPPQSPVDADACLWMDGAQAQTELLVRCVDSSGVIPASGWVGPAIPNDQLSVADCMQMLE